MCCAEECPELGHGRGVGHLSACGQREGGKVLCVVLCQAVTTNFLGKERKSVEPSHTITGLRANSRIVL